MKKNLELSIIIAAKILKFTAQNISKKVCEKKLSQMSSVVCIYFDIRNICTCKRKMVSDN